MADTLLLVDDDASVLRAIGDYFERVGYEVWRDGTGEQAIDTFHRVRPDVVLLDLYLPDSSGLAVLERLRREGAAATLLSRPRPNPSSGRDEERRAEEILVA